MKKLTKEQLLQEYLDMEYYNLLKYSATYLMSEPKRGYTEEWRQTKHRISLVEEMIATETREEETVQEEVVQESYQMHEGPGYMTCPRDKMRGEIPS